MPCNNTLHYTHEGDSWRGCREGGKGGAADIATERRGWNNDMYVCDGHPHGGWGSLVLLLLLYIGNDILVWVLIGSFGRRHVSYADKQSYIELGILKTYVASPELFFYPIRTKKALTLFFSAING